VKNFQQADLLKMDGIAGQRTWSALKHRFAGLQGHLADGACVTHGK
jgi:peptidoglycan hydrolase-like protein with peptidoglycan-binding domain